MTGGILLRELAHQLVHEVNRQRDVNATYPLQHGLVHGNDCFVLIEDRRTAAPAGGGRFIGDNVGRYVGHVALRRQGADELPVSLHQPDYVASGAFENRLADGWRRTSKQRINASRITQHNHRFADMRRSSGRQRDGPLAWRPVGSQEGDISLIRNTDFLQEIGRLVAEEKQPQKEHLRLKSGLDRLLSRAIGFPHPHDVSIRDNSSLLIDEERRASEVDQERRRNSFQRDKRVPILVHVRIAQLGQP